MVTLSSACARCRDRRVCLCRDEQEAILSKEHLQQFQLVWVEFDPDGVGIVSRDHLNQLLRQLPYPMGYKDRPLGAPPTLKELRDRLGRMDVKLYQHKFVTFWDFGAGLARIAFEEEARHHGETFELPKSVRAASLLSWREPLCVCCHLIDRRVFV